MRWAVSLVTLTSVSSERNWVPPAAFLASVPAGQGTRKSAVSGDLEVALDRLSDPHLVPSLGFEQVLEFERQGHCTTRGLISAAELSALQQPIRAAFAEREFAAWHHSARIMLGDEAVIDDFGESLFETSEECREALEAHEVELPFLQVLFTAF